MGALIIIQATRLAVELRAPSQKTNTSFSPCQHTQTILHSSRNSQRKCTKNPHDLNGSLWQSALFYLTIQFVLQTRRTVLQPEGVLSMGTREVVALAHCDRFAAFAFCLNACGAYAVYMKKP